MNNNADDRNLSAALGELRDLPGEPDWQAMEERLVQTFSERSIAHAGRSRTPSHDRWRWTAAAAVVFLAAAVTFYLPSSRYGAAVAPRLEPPPSTGSAVARAAQATQPTTPANEQPARATPPPTSPPPSARRPKPATAPGSTTRSTPPAATAAVSEFVVLPAAFALPEFESGRIVRMEVPLAMLPAYGLELVPDAAPSAVQAEFLIGQDGVPRAIRLASNSQR